MRFFLDSMAIAAHSLRTRKVRSGLSILGIVVGILTVASLLSIALGVKKEIVGNIEGLGSNLVAVVPGKIDNGGSPNFLAQVGTSPLTEEDFNDIRVQASEAQNLSAAMLLVGTVTAGDTAIPSAIIAAASPGMEKTLNMKIGKGRFIEEEDERGKKRVVVLGASAVQGLFGGEEAVDRKVEIRGQEFSVLGVLQNVPTAVNFGGSDMNTMVMMPLQTGWDITGTKQIFRIMMQAPNADALVLLQEKVKRIILENHKGAEDFSVLTQEELVGLVSGVLDILTAMLGALSAISLIVAGIGIMNIMLVSVSERTREIGIRKAVGATQFAILLQFLIESVILTFLGGVVAVVLFSVGVTLVAARVPFPLEIDPMVLAVSLAFSALVGLVFGVIPAYKASRKDPVDALRYE